MSDSGKELTATLYSLVHSLERFGPMPGWSNVPAGGVYFFFERGETVTLDGQSVDRIVRVGTHRTDGGFNRRLRRHFSGSRRSSAFRRHLGLALLARMGPGPREPWHGSRARQERSWILKSGATNCCASVSPS